MVRGFDKRLTSISIGCGGARGGASIGSILRGRAALSTYVDGVRRGDALYFTGRSLRPRRGLSGWTRREFSTDGWRGSSLLLEIGGRQRIVRII